MDIINIPINKDLWKGFYNNQNKTSFSNSIKQQVYNNQSIDKNNQENKSNKNLKDIADCIIVVLGLCIVSMPLIANIKAGKAEKIAKQAEKLEKRTQTLANKVENLKNKETEHVQKLPLICKIGILFDKLAERKELTNNLIYGLGTILIEPLVILFSPFGKKKSTKEDKIFAVWRQPISFLTTFGLQFSIDKFFHGLIPKLSRQGFLGEEFKSKLKNFEDLPLKNKTKLKAAQEIFIILLNLATLPISCMLQNIFYGKFMKHFHSQSRKESEKA